VEARSWQGLVRLGLVQLVSGNCRCRCRPLSSTAGAAECLCKAFQC
jgi:hypothetical protein